MSERIASRIYEESWSASLGTNKRTVTKVDGLTLGVAGIVGTGKKVLDVGCGDGHGLIALRDAGNEAVGIDISRAAAEACRGRGLNAMVLDIENDSIDALAPHAPFDAVVMMDVLEHLMDPIEALRGKVLPLLKPGGVVVATIPNFVFLRYRLEMLMGRISHFNNDDATGFDPPRPYNLGHKTMFNRRNIRETFELSGFRKVSVEPDLLMESLTGFWRHPLPQALRRAAKVAWPTLLAARFLAVAEK